MNQGKSRLSFGGSPRAVSSASPTRTKLPWVDPRSDPKPPTQVPRRRVAKEFAEIAALHELCKQGRIYDVERWIQAGKSMQLAYHDVPFYQQIETALTIALESHQFGLTFLLLCNGYRTDLEPHSPLDIALQQRNSEVVDLLLAWVPTRWRLAPTRYSTPTRSPSWSGSGAWAVT